MENIIKKYPVKKQKQRIIYSHRSFSVDLHGFTKQESIKKLSWLEEYIAFHKEETIQIITGIGSGILRTLVIQYLKKWENNEIIQEWKEKKNNIKDDIEDDIEEKKQTEKTGVFLFIV